MADLTTIADITPEYLRDMYLEMLDSPSYKLYKALCDEGLIDMSDFTTLMRFMKAWRTATQ